MNVRYGMLLLTAGLCFASSVSTAPAVAQNNLKMVRPNVTVVACPLREIRRELATPLPDGWWSTPTVDTLKRTYIETIGGNPALVCNYGIAGQIMHLPPPGMVCRPNPTGFDCRP